MNIWVKFMIAGIVIGVASFAALYLTHQRVWVYVNVLAFISTYVGWFGILFKGIK